jgi:hypothetical protein
MKKLHLVPFVFAFVAMLAFGLPVAAATTVVVTPTNTQGWYAVDVRTGGEINYVADATSPYPTGALQLKTDNTNGAKAQYLKSANVPLSTVNELSYATKQVSGPSVAAASYQLVVDLNGATPGGIGTLVYEPYYNGIVTPTIWQQWDVSAGQFWSSQSFTEGMCSVENGQGGAPFYTLAGLKAVCPNAVILGFGVNVGTYNPNYNVETDGVNFNGTTYDFELTNVPTAKEQCKNGGWQNVTDADGHAFKNQGDCVSYVATGGKGK